MAQSLSPLTFRQPNSVPLSTSSPRNRPLSPVVSYCSLRTGPSGFGCGLVHKTKLFGSRSSNFPTLKRSCSNDYKNFSDEDMKEQIEELRKRLNVEEDDAAEVAETSGFNRDSNFTRKGFPISLEDSIEKEPEGEEEEEEEEGKTGILDYCSVKKAFSSMVFMIRELQSYAMHIREHLTCEDLQGIMAKVHREMNASFVWLFQQVFAQTPAFMVFVMVLMANFTVHSMTSEPALATQAKVTTMTVTEEETVVKKRRGRDSVVALPEERNGGKWEQTEEEMKLWNLVVEEAMQMQQQTGGYVLDHQAMKKFVSPLTVEIQTDDYEEFFRTDLLYQISISKEPNNPLLLTNYARFLYLVSKDNDRAEQCFKRAIMVEPPDAEALSSYADFLWVVKKDLWEAEERYQQAMEVDPGNAHHSSKYANFLWSTGAEDTCFPLLQQQQQDDDHHDETT